MLMHSCQMSYNETYMYARIIQTISLCKSLAINIPIRALLLFNDRKVVRDVSYAISAKQKLDIYTPDKPLASSKLRPVVVVVHGGGWIIGDKRERALFSAALAKEGYVVCSINYRLAPQHPFPTAIADFLLALTWVHNHIRKYGGDPDNLSVIGDSAGAHIASLGMTSAEQQQQLYGIDAKRALRSVKRLALYYGIYNLRTVAKINRPNLKTYLRSFMGIKDIDKFQYEELASPVNCVKDFPPTLLIVSEVDPLYSQTIELRDAMKAAHKEYELLFLGKEDYPSVRHGFQSLVWSKGAKAAFLKVVAFLNSNPTK